jgi:hypothetical protein
VWPAACLKFLPNDIGPVCAVVTHLTKAGRMISSESVLCLPAMVQQACFVYTAEF